MGSAFRNTFCLWLTHSRVWCVASREMVLIFMLAGQWYTATGTGGLHRATKKSAVNSAYSAVQLRPRADSVTRTQPLAVAQASCQASSRLRHDSSIITWQAEKSGCNLDIESSNFWSNRWEARSSCLLAPAGAAVVLTTHQPHSPHAAVHRAPSPSTPALKQLIAFQLY